VITQNRVSRWAVYFNIGNTNGVGNPPGNVGTPIATSPKLRQAFEEAINRMTFNRVVNRGVGHPDCTFIPIALKAWYAATDVPCTPYNPADAKKLVAASGIPNPTVRLQVTTATGPVLAAQFIQAAEAAVGINVVIVPEDSPTLVANLNSGNYDAAYVGLQLGIDPGPSFLSTMGTAGSFNSFGYSNPRLDLVIANGFKATTTKARDTLYKVAQQIIQNDRPWLVLYHAVTLAGVTTKVKLGDTTFDDYVFGQYAS